MENKNLSAFACVGERYMQRGLTKREYFAAKAMQGILSNGEYFNKLNSDEELAMSSYRIADAMLMEK